MKTIEMNSFAGDICLKEITIPDSVTCIEVCAFWESGLTSLTIPEHVTKIGHQIVQECRSLEKIVVSANNPVYDSRDNCNAIIEKETNALIQGCKTTIIPDSVTCIDYAAFSGCYGLESIVIPDGVKSIGDCAFYYCRNLNSLTIPDGVTSIGTGAFMEVPLIIYDNSAMYDEESVAWGAYRWEKSDGAVVYERVVPGEDEEEDEEDWD